MPSASERCWWSKGEVEDETTPSRFQLKLCSKTRPWASYSPSGVYTIDYRDKFPHGDDSDINYVCGTRDVKIITLVQAATNTADTGARDLRKA